MKQTLVPEWAPSTGTTPGTSLGWTMTSNGAVSHPSLGPDPSLGTRFTSAGTDNAIAGLISADALCWRGNANYFGGFSFSARFSMSKNVAVGRAFIGLSESKNSLVAANPSSFGNTIGIGFDSTDSFEGNWQLIRTDRPPSVKTDLGSAAKRNATDVYDLTITAVPTEHRWSFT